MSELEPGAPYVEVDAKRSFDDVPVEVDWHDYLARLRRPGSAVSVSDAVRPIRSQATGLQYRCSVAGVTSKRATAQIVWPAIAGATLADGSVTWVAEAISTASLRTTITAEDWPAVAGLTLTAEVNADLRYVVNVAGGVDGQTYLVKHQVTLANGEDKEAVAVLPIRD